MIQLIKGDCLVEMKNIPDKSIDAIICDLPYGSTACKWDSVIPFDKLWEQYRRVIKKGGTIVLTASQPFTTNLIASNIEWFKYNLVWVKPQGVDPFMAKIRPLNNIEDVLIFCDGKTIYNPQKTKGKPYSITRDKKQRIKETNGTVMRETTTVNGGDRLPTRILEFKQEKGLHPTQKPVALLEYLIKTYTNEGETVLDNCMGSGTTGVACVNLNRNFIGIEMDDKYFEIAQNRINKALIENDTTTGIPAKD